MYYFIFITDAVESKNVVSHRARASCFGLVLVTEQFLSGESSTVVQFAVSEYTQKGRFAGVNVTNDGHSNLEKILLVEPAAHEVLSCETLIDFYLTQEHAISLEGCREGLQSSDRRLVLVRFQTILGTVFSLFNKYMKKII